jgi:hypothetical protein
VKVFRSTNHGELSHFCEFRVDSDYVGWFAVISQVADGGKDDLVLRGVKISAVDLSISQDAMHNVDGQQHASQSALFGV